MFFLGIVLIVTFGGMAGAIIGLYMLNKELQKDNEALDACLTAYEKMATSQNKMIQECHEVIEKLLEPASNDTTNHLKN